MQNYAPTPRVAPRSTTCRRKSNYTKFTHTHVLGTRRIHIDVYTPKFARRRMQLLGERERERGYKGGGGLRVYEYCSPDLLIIDAQTQEVT